MITEDLLAEATGSYELTWVSDQSAALEALASETFEVCLLDYRLGAQHGLEVHENLLESAGLMPFILLTGLSDETVDRQAMEAGVADYLVKTGLTASTLDRAIRYAISQAQTLQSLRDSEERNRSLVEAATDGIALLNSEGFIVGTNPAMGTIFAQPDEELKTQRLSDLVADMPSLRASTYGVGAPPIQNLLRSARTVNGPVPVELSLAPWESAGSHYWTAIVRDVTEREELNQKLSHQAYHDQVTGLANRTMFNERLTANLARAERYDSVAALVFLDLDDFKRINDSHGHAVGDMLLVEVGKRLRQCTRESDLVARFGGDEFAICADYPASNRGEGILLAARVVDILSQPFLLGSLRIDITSSVGVALDNGTGLDSETFVTHADVAMYQAKERGKNTFAVFEDTMHAELLERLELDNDYAPGLERGEFMLQYQPLIDVPTRRILGFEGLCRWDHPKRGRLYPDRFIEQAESSGRISALGSYLVGLACRDAQKFTALTGEEPYISVNVSPRQLASTEIIDSVYHALGDSGLDPNRLVLEITESAMMLDFDVAVKHLVAVKDLGVRLALDDFGSGFSSLNLLHRLPLDIVKLDRLFMSDVASSTGAANIVRSISKLCQTLGMAALAEGIETGEEHDFIAESGFDIGQGYFYARPADFDDAVKLFDAQGGAQAA